MGPTDDGPQVTVESRGIAAVPLDDMTLYRWIRAGLLHLPTPGTGHRRSYPEAELRAMRAVDSIRRLGGAEPQGESWNAARYALARDVAEAARTHASGDVVDIASPVPFVRHVLVVPGP